MGNNIGFEVDDESVKLAYVEEDHKNVEFIRQLKSKFLHKDFEWQNTTVFLFQCTIEEFLDYPTSENVKLLRDQFNYILEAEKFSVKTNTQTINKLKRNKKLKEALETILKVREFELKHQERTERAVESIKFLEESDPLFYFSELLKLTELHLGFHNLDKKLYQKAPEDSLMVMLRNGTTLYRMEKGRNAKRIGGSIIGQKTIMNILQMRIKGKTTKQIFQMAMNSGNLKNIDMMVEDIYGKNTTNLGLPADIIASSLGKIGKMSPQELVQQKDEDIARSLITAFAINTASLTAMFLQENSLQTAIILTDLFHYDKFYCLTQSIFSVFAPGKNILFCKHSPFVGCLGSALQG